MSSSPVARLFNIVSRVYDLPVLQALVYKPAQDLALAELRRAGVRRVLDVGCGTGIFSSRMHNELGAEVIGCDLSPGMLEQAAARNGEVVWIRSDSRQLPISNASVDAVVCTEAFHFFDQAATLDEFHRVLRPDGLLLVAMINPRTAVGEAALESQVRLGTWPTARRMRTLFEGAGFVVAKQHRVRRLASGILPTRLTVGRRVG